MIEMAKIYSNKKINSSLSVLVLAIVYQVL